MKSFFPQTTKQFLQTNRSNILGNVWSTKGIDFQSNLGVIRLAQKLVINTGTTDSSSNFYGNTGAIKHFDGRMWAISGISILVNTGNNFVSAFSADASTGFVSTYNVYKSDLALFNARLWSTTTGKLYSKASNGSGTGAWNDRTGGASIAGNTLKLLYFKRLNRLYFFDSNTVVGSISTGNTVVITGDYTINIGTTNKTMNTMVQTSSSIWIGTVGPSTGTTSEGFYGSIIQWDGLSAQATNEFFIQTGGILAMTVLNDIPYAIDTEGRVLKYTGYSFEEIQRLPIDRVMLSDANVINSSSGTNGNAKPIHFAGFIPTKDNTLLVLVNNLNNPSADPGITENLPSGIWELDLATRNFTHKYSPTLSTLASSTITDFGQNRVYATGGLAIDTISSGENAGKSTVMAGIAYYSNATTIASAIYIDAPVSSTADLEGQKRGYFVTTFIETQDAEDNWGRMWTSFRKFQSTTDNIVFKYRTSEEKPLEATITWVNTTSFTTTTDISAYGPTATGFNGTIGGEVEITQGTGSGATPHITAISLNVGTYTVTLDTAVTGVTTGTAKARFQKWVRIGDVYAVVAQTKAWAQLSIDNANESRIQVKCCLQWTGNGELYRNVLWSDPNNKITY